MTFATSNNNDNIRKIWNETQPWSPRQRDVNEALPPTLSFWDQPVYQPPKDEFVRPGALDFKKIKSR